MNVLITNAAIGVGAEVAHRFVQNGHRVITTGMSAEALELTFTDLSKNVMPLALNDGMSRNSIREALNSLPEEWRKIDVLINNATLSLGNQVSYEASLDDWQDMIDANCKAVVAMTLEILPGMLERRVGTILNLSSSIEKEPTSGRAVYSATAAFVHQFTFDLLSSLKNTGVRATCLAPKINTGPTKDNGLEVHELIEGPVPPIDSHIADTVYWVATLPAHIDINQVELAQTGELFSPLIFKQSLNDSIQ